MDISLMDLSMLANQIRKSTIDIDPKDLANQLDMLGLDAERALLRAQYQDKRPAPTVRVRINVATSVKGIVTTDTTLEYFGDIRDTDIRDIDLDAIIGVRLQLSEKVDLAYPPPALT